MDNAICVQIPCFSGRGMRCINTREVASLWKVASGACEIGLNFLLREYMKRRFVCQLDLGGILILSGLDEINFKDYRLIFQGKNHLAKYDPMR